MTAAAEFLETLAAGDHVAVDLAGAGRWVGFEFIGPHPSRPSLVFRLPPAAQAQNEQMTVEFPRTLLEEAPVRLQRAAEVQFWKRCPRCARVPHDAPDYDDCPRCQGRHEVTYDPWNEAPPGAMFTAIIFHDSGPDEKDRRRYALEWTSQSGVRRAQEFHSAQWRQDAAAVERWREQANG